MGFHAWAVCGAASICLGMVIPGREVDAAPPHPFPRRYVVRSWTESDGLPETPLTGVVVAADGAIVCSSRTQLVRFDGDVFEPYPEDVTRALHDAIGTFFGIAGDDQQRLWVRGARGVGWIVADPHTSGGWRATVYPIHDGRPIHSMAGGPQGTMVFIGPGTLRMFDGSSIVDLPVGTSSGDPPSWRYGDVDPRTGDVWLWGSNERGRTLHHTRLTARERMTPPECVDVPGVSDAVVTMSMAGDRPVALLQDGLAARQDGQWKMLEPSLPAAEHGPSGKVVVATDGTLWISRHSGIAAFGAGGLQPVVAGLPDFSLFTRGLVADRSGGVWAACDGGLVAVRPATVRFESVADCRAIHVAADGSVLAGVPGAVMKMSPAVAPDSGGSAAEAMPLVGELPPGVTATALLEDRDARVWVGTEDHYLLRLERGKMSQVTRQESRLRELRTITALAEDEAGHIWVGTSNGLARQTAGSDEFAMVPDGDDPVHGAVLALVADPRGGVLCATFARGVEHYDGDGVATAVLASVDLPGRRRLALCRDSAGIVWIGGEQGLVRIASDGQARRFTAAHGLVDSAIRHITDDQIDGGRLWLATQSGRIQGIRRADLDGLAAGRIDVVRGVVLGPHAGVGGGECTGRITVSPRRARGMPVVVPFTNGLVFLDSAREALPPPTERPEVGRDPVQPGRFTFSMPGLHWGEPLLFQTRLHGVDPDWSPPSGDRRRDYAAMSPGDHVFEVRTVAGENDRDFATASLPVTVPRPWWQAPWVLGSAGVLAAAGAATTAWGATRRRARRMIERLEREREMNRERTRIARDIHDVLGAGLTRVALTSDLARHSDLAPGDVGERFDAIYRDARSLARSLDEIVWAVNPQNDTLAEFVMYVVNDIEESVEAGGLTLRLDLSEELPDDRRLDTHVRHHLCLAIREVVTNVLRHAHATRIDVSIAMHGDTLAVRIEDDGIGLHAAPASHGGGNGLANIRHRIGVLHGRVSFTPAGDHGTVVAIDVPLGVLDSRYFQAS